MLYWALDYADDCECELVVDDQLYSTAEAAELAREATGLPELYDVASYRYIDLLDVYDCDKLEIDENLKVRCG